MSLIGPTLGSDGYYDENGDWQRTKFCFVSCGDRCTCKPPGGIWHINRSVEAVKEKEEKKNE